MGRDRDPCVQNEAVNAAAGVEITTYCAMNAAKQDVWKTTALPHAPGFMAAPGASDRILKQYCKAFNDRFIKGTDDINRV